MTTAPTTFARIALTLLHPSPLNPRQHFDPSAIAEMSRSLRELGQVTPILVRPHPKKKGGFEIAAGETRFMAAKEAGLTELKAEIEEMDDARFLLVISLENIGRRNLRPMEEARAYRNLLEAGKDEAFIAAQRGVDVGYVKDRLRLFKLSPEIVKLLDAERILLGHALELCKVSVEVQDEAIHAVLFLDHERQRLSPAQDRLQLQGEALEDRKACTVGELRTWINDHVRLDLGAESAGDLFPATVEKVTEWRAKDRKSVAITHDFRVHPDAKKGGGRILGAQSWRDADPTHKAKECSHSVLGVVEAGPGRGEAFLVCVARDKCKTHWGREIAEKKKAQPKNPATMTPAEKRRAAADEKARLKRAQSAADENMRREAMGAGLRTAFLEAIAKAAKKQPITARTMMGQMLIDGVENGLRGHKIDIKPGRTADDLLRYLAACSMVSFVNNHVHWVGYLKDLTNLGKHIGVDVAKVMKAEMKRLAAEAKAKPAEGAEAGEAADDEGDDE